MFNSGGAECCSVVNELEMHVDCFVAFRVQISTSQGHLATFVYLFVIVFQTHICRPRKIKSKRTYDVIKLMTAVIAKYSPVWETSFILEQFQPWQIDLIFVETSSLYCAYCDLFVDAG